MSISLERFEQVEVPELATTLRNAGVSGAGGAGFPTYAKWKRLDEARCLLVNHQESEPNYYIDKWLGESRADEFATLFDALLGDAFELVVVCGKETNRDPWMNELEEALDGTVYTPDQLPLDPDDESGLVFAYTDDKYEYGMESVLLRLVAGVVMGDDLPMDHGWIVQNTETVWNVFRTLERGEPVTRKFVHVDGNVPHHRFLEVPIGTPASTLLEAAGRPPADLGEDETIVDGGPGWCFRIDRAPSAFGVSKRTNCVLALDEEMVEKNTLGNGRVQVLNPVDWDANHETEPSSLVPDTVRIPLITNPDFDHVVSRSRPIVEEGVDVSTGEMIAVPSDGAISIAQHASVDGTVTAVTERHVEIRRDSEIEAEAADRMDGEPAVYWTWCTDCGRYVARPEWEHLDEGTDYVCEDCR